MKNRILKIRKDSKLNQEDFGLRLNLTKNYISLRNEIASRLIELFLIYVGNLTSMKIG